MTIMRRATLTAVITGLWVFCFDLSARQVDVRVNDAQGQPIPCRIHLYDEADKPVRPPALPFFRDHFVIDGTATLDLPTGTYRYEIARGPEYRQTVGKLDVPDGEQPLRLQTELQRRTEIRKQGWYSSDLHIHRPIEQIEQLMRAEDLDYGPVITWWNKRNPWQDQQQPPQLLRKFDGHRLYHIMAGEDEREGGALLYFGLPRPIDITRADREHPSPLVFVEQAEESDENVWIDIEKPFWWDTPVWLASGKPDSIGIANNHMNRSGMYESEAWGRPRDTSELPNPLGNGYWTQEIYYHVLNTGLRIPPSAGSASGVLPNPVGYNRVYVHLEDNFTEERWWNGLRAGRCFVTNGPILLCQAAGKHPGHVFQEPSPFQVELDVKVSSDEAIRSIEVIHNGNVVQRLPHVDGQAQKTTVTISKSGWFLLRAIVDNPKTFRFASTGPYYLELGDSPGYVSRDSVRFFQDWVAERIARARDNIADARKRQDVLRFHHSAAQFWRQRERAATD